MRLRSRGWMRAADAGSTRLQPAVQSWSSPRRSPIRSSRARSAASAAGPGNRPARQRAEVEAGAADENRHAAAGVNGPDGDGGIARVARRRVDLGRLDDVDEVMRDALLRFGRHLVGADVEAAIDRGRIAVDDLAAEVVAPPPAPARSCRSPSVRGWPRRRAVRLARHLPHDEHRQQRHDDDAGPAAGPASAATWPLRRRRFVVEERHREERLVGRVLGRQRLRRVRGEQRVVGRAVERVHRRTGRRRSTSVIDPSLWTLNGMTTRPRMRHRRVGHEPVALDLRDEAANPRAELDALGVELNRRPEFVDRRPAGCRTTRAARTSAGRAAPRPARRPAAAGVGGGAVPAARRAASRAARVRSSGCSAGGAGSGSAPRPLRRAPRVPPRRARPSCRARTAAGSRAARPSAAPRPAVHVRQLGPRRRRRAPACRAAARRRRSAAILVCGRGCAFAAASALGARGPAAARPGCGANRSEQHDHARARRPTARRPRAGRSRCRPPRRRIVAIVEVEVHEAVASIIPAAFRAPVQRAARPRPCGRCRDRRRPASAAGCERLDQARRRAACRQRPARTETPRPRPAGSRRRRRAARPAGRCAAARAGSTRGRRWRSAGHAGQAELEDREPAARAQHPQHLAAGQPSVCCTLRMPNAIVTRVHRSVGHRQAHRVAADQLHARRQPGRGDLVARRARSISPAKSTPTTRAAPGRAVAAPIATSAVPVHTSSSRSRAGQRQRLDRAPPPVAIEAGREHACSAGRSARRWRRTSRRSARAPCRAVPRPVDGRTRPQSTYSATAVVTRYRMPT